MHREDVALTRVALETVGQVGRDVVDVQPKTNTVVVGTAAAGLPPEIGARWVAAIRASLQDPALRERFATLKDVERAAADPRSGVELVGSLDTPGVADLLRRADHIFIEELRRADLYDKTSQAFAVFLPVKSVGVMGDGRTYDYVVALRAVITSDFMTAHWAELPYSLLGRVSNRIINEISGISRVTYDVSSKPPATIEWE